MNDILEIELTSDGFDWTVIGLLAVAWIYLATFYGLAAFSKVMP